MSATKSPLSIELESCPAGAVGLAVLQVVYRVQNVQSCYATRAGVVRFVNATHSGVLVATCGGRHVVVHEVKPDGSAGDRLAVITGTTPDFN